MAKGCKTRKKKENKNTQEKQKIHKKKNIQEKQIKTKPE